MSKVLSSSAQERVVVSRAMNPPVTQRIWFRGAAYKTHAFASCKGCGGPYFAQTYRGNPDARSRCWTCGYGGFEQGRDPETGTIERLPYQGVSLVNDEVLFRCERFLSLMDKFVNWIISRLILR